jgi:hypothetical protein
VGSVGMAPPGIVSAQGQYLERVAVLQVAILLPFLARKSKRFQGVKLRFRPGVLNCQGELVQRTLRSACRIP